MPPPHLDGNPFPLDPVPLDPVPIEAFSFELSEPFDSYEFVLVLALFVCEPLGLLETFDLELFLLELYLLELLDAGLFSLSY